MLEIRPVFRMNPAPDPVKKRSNPWNSTPDPNLWENAWKMLFLTDPEKGSDFKILDADSDLQHCTASNNVFYSLFVTFRFACHWSLQINYTKIFTKVSKIYYHFNVDYL